VFDKFDFDRKTVIYNGSWFFSDIVEWAVQLAYPSLGQEFTLHQYGNSALEETNFDASVVTIFDDDETEEDGDFIMQDVMDILRTLIPKYPKWRFTYEKLDTLKKKAKEMEFLGVVASRFEPSIFVLQRNKKFILEGVENIRELETVTGFLSNVSKGTARPAYLSEPDPEKERDGDDCLILTGRNFPQYAFDPKKDVFVLFTSNTSKNPGQLGLTVNDNNRDLAKAGSGPGNVVCEDCQKLEPEWKKLAKAVKGGVVLARMEATKNHCEEEVGDGEMPKTILYPAVPAHKKMKKRIVYRGLGTAANMLDFLLENTLHEVKSDEL